MTGSATVLCINAGSSSLKCALYNGAPLDHPVAIATVLVEGVGGPSGRWTVRDDTGAIVEATDEALTDHRQALVIALEGLHDSNYGSPDAVGHRVVHGGRHLTDHAVLDDDVLAALHAAIPLAPLHLPSELAAVQAIADELPGVPQVVCLDTAFHRTLPEAARRLPLPRWVRNEGVTRYGFHGLSYEYLVDRLGARALGRAVLAHLGSGASLAAVIDGRSVDTTMGFTPAGGVVMGTRPGDIDPGALVFVMRERGLDAEALEHLINHESGLLGLSGSCADMHELLHDEHDPDAALAVEIFCRQVRKAIGGLATVLGGLDTIVFTAGIGENEPDIRARVCTGLELLGVAIDDERNATHAPVISASTSRVAVRVEPTDENLMIARHTLRLLARSTT